MKEYEYIAEKLPEEEVWKDIIGFEGFYQVSNMGNVRSLDRVIKSNHRRIWARKGRPLKAYPNHDGYLTVKLNKNRHSKTITAHRLVAIHFVPNPGNLPEVNHKDFNRSNPRASNLEWSTHKDNIAHTVANTNHYSSCRTGEKNGRSVLSESQVCEIRKRYVYGSKEYGLRGLAKRYGVGRTTIGHVIRKESWQDASV